MLEDSRHFEKTGVRELVRGRSPAGSADVNKGTVLVRPASGNELSDSMWLDTEFHGPWLLMKNAGATGIEQGPVDAGQALSAGVEMEASAFGCDSKVLERALSRLLENAAAHSLDFGRDHETDAAPGLGEGLSHDPCLGAGDFAGACLRTCV